MNRSTSKFSWFLLGLGSSLQLFGTSLSFTELYILCACPLLFARELPELKRHGVMPLFVLGILLIVGCIGACIANHTSFNYAIRGLATSCLLPSTIVVAHSMLKRNMGGFKWLLVGLAFSNTLSTFVFQHSFEVDALAGGQAGAEAVQDIMNGPIFWISRLSPYMYLYPRGWYLQCPIWISALLPLFLAVFAILSSASGRSSALSAIGCAVLILIGGKSRWRIRRNICQRFWLMLILAVFGISAVNFAYRTAAESGLLGEKSQKKYEEQTKGDRSIKALLLGGRMSTFSGLFACMDRPVWGFGPWPRDENGYAAEFLSTYANEEDYNNFIASESRRLALGLPRLIPGHSHITGFWLTNGIFGLIFWLYVLFLLVRFLKEDCWAVPQWYMWLAAGAPGLIWNIIFSPLSERVYEMFYVVALLMARSVRKGTLPLSQDLLEEIQRQELRSR